MKINFMIAALFVQSTGCYSNLSHVDLWDKGRDARKYQDPYPVIAQVRGHVKCGKVLTGTAPTKQLGFII